ncbi:MAG: hypothetical protein PVH11_04830 [Anaerolineae bacterium]|jgi:hypothetical protein
MVVTKQTRFAGYDCIRLQNDLLSLWVTRAVGPRIIGLALKGGDNLFAVLPDATTECPGQGVFAFRGGHRLWHAPESLERTYLPDDDPLLISETGHGIRVIQPLEPSTGIQKSLTISLAARSARITVDHGLQNLGKWPVALAPWAITQLRPGGIAVLPQAVAPVDAHRLLPNRHIVLWPYTRLDSPHIVWQQRYLFVTARMEVGKLKLGFPNPSGWLGYSVDDTLFVKYAAYDPRAVYFDRGSSSECYCDARCLELETLGPRTTLAPGESVSHRETWAVYRDISLQPDTLVMDDLVAALDLTEYEKPSAESRAVD